MANGKPSTRKEPETLLPMMQVLTIVMCTTSWFISALVIFPFVPFAVERLFPMLKRTQLGTRTGLLDGTFFIGLLLGGIIMGWAGDKYARRPMILWGTFVCTFFSIAFGVIISKSFIGALTCRFLWGALSANISVGRTMLSEITDSSNRSRAFAMMGLGPSVGSLIGGGMGGILAEPAEKYHILDYAFFRAYPYSLPVFAAGSVNLVSWVLAYFYLHETKHSKTKDKEASLQTIQSSYIRLNSGSETDPLLVSVEGLVAQIKTVETKHSWRKILMSADVVKPLLLTFLDGFCHAYYLTIVPLWTMNDYDNWGFNLGTTGIGLLRLVSLPSDIILLLYLYPKLVRYLSPTISCKFFGVCWTLVFLSSPLISFANRDGKVVMWVLLVIVVTCNNGLASCCFSSDGVVLGNAVESDIRGRLYGYRQGMVGLARFGGAVCGGTIFSWSFNNQLGFFPFDFFFSWIVLVFLMIVYTSIACTLPLRLNFDPLERRKSSTISVEMNNRADVVQIGCYGDDLRNNYINRQR